MVQDQAVRWCARRQGYGVHDAKMEQHDGVHDGCTEQHDSVHDGVHDAKAEHTTMCMTPRPFQLVCAQHVNGGASVLNRLSKPWCAGREWRGGSAPWTR